MSVKSTQELKQLQTRLSKLESERASISEEVTRLNTMKGVIHNQMQGIESQIRKLKQASIDPVVSEHAMLRYIERVIGIDLEELKARILPDTTKALIKQLGGSGKFPADGFRVVVKDNTVVTVEDL